MICWTVGTDSNKKGVLINLVPIPYIFEKYFSKSWIGDVKKLYSMIKKS